MTQLALPSRKPAKSIPLWIYGLSAIAFLAIASVVILLTAKPFGLVGDAPPVFKTVPVRQGPLETRVVVKGDLQAVVNIDVNCEVEGATAINELVPEGAWVHKGDTLVVLDSSEIRQRLEDSTIDLERAQADVTTAEEMLDIQKSQNEANLEAAQVALDLARIDLTKYIEGTYPSQLADSKMALEKAQTGLKTKQDDLAQTRSLFSKGFVTATEVKNRELDVASAERDVTKAQTDLKVLTDYTNKAELAKVKSAVAQAEQKLERTKRESAANLSQKSADLRAKRQQLELRSRRVDRFRRHFEACTIKAPADGLVVYLNDGRRDGVQIQEGATVRERQTLMRLPDTSAMKVVLKVNESQIGGLELGQSAVIRLANHPVPLTGQVTKISPVADSADRWMNPDRKDYPVDVVLDETPEGLKPGMSAEVSVLVSRVENANAVPLTTLYSAGPDRYVFTPAGESAKPVKVKVGATNEQDAQILAGIEPGESVILLEPGQGRIFLEKAGIAIAEMPAKDPQRRKDRRKGPAEAPAADTPAADKAPAASSASPAA